MRPRQLSPAIWADKKFAPLELVAQLLYIGMITLCEDYGQVKGDPVEFRLKLWPWGMVPIDDVGRAMKAVLLSELVVEYNEDHYFLPGWFKHQTQQYYGAWKLDEIPKEILDKNPDYRDAMREARHTGRATRQEAEKRRRRVPTPAELNPETLGEAMQIQALADESDEAGRKVTALLGMARSARPKVVLDIDQVRTYLQDLADIPGEMVEASCRELRKEKPYMFHQSVIREKVVDLFGRTPSKRPQRALDADALVLALSKGRRPFEEAVTMLNDSKRRKSALMDVWNRMDQVSGGSVGTIVNDIYGDMDLIDDRIVPVWKEVNRRGRNDDEITETTG